MSIEANRKPFGKSNIKKNLKENKLVLILLGIFMSLGVFAVILMFVSDILIVKTGVGIFGGIGIIAVILIYVIWLLYVLCVDRDYEENTILVMDFSDEMVGKIKENFSLKGISWKTISATLLKAQLLNNYNKEHWIDVANYAVFLHERGKEEIEEEKDLTCKHCGSKAVFPEELVDIGNSVAQRYVCGDCGAILEIEYDENFEEVSSDFE